MRGVTTAGGSLLKAIAILAITSGLFAVRGQVLPSLGQTQISGKILSVDLQKKTLRVEAEKPAGTASVKQPMDISFTDQTRVTKEGGQQAQPADLRTGESVRIEFAAQNGKNVARSISIQPAGAGAPGAPETPTPGGGGGPGAPSPANPTR